MLKRGREPEEEWLAKRFCQAHGGGRICPDSALAVNGGSGHGACPERGSDATQYRSCMQVNPDLASRLNPILDASHLRDLRTSPPNSECLKGTRLRLISKTLSWACASLHDPLYRPHILWIFGYAGCGKSAVSLAIARELAKEDRLAASFFFFRGAGDRGGATRLIDTIVCQMVEVVPGMLNLIKDVIRRKRWRVPSSAAEFSAQFTELVLEPILSAAGTLQSSPLTIVLDGVDECEDHEKIAHLVKAVIVWFDNHPFAPLRLVIASRVEDHLHQLLHSSSQVRLLDLVSHTSDGDIRNAIEARLEKERSGGTLTLEKSWPSISDKWQLIERIGKSFIFMNTLLGELFKPIATDGRTPMDRLPLLLTASPSFDTLFKSILEPVEQVPYFFDIITTIILAQRALSVVEVADLLEIKVVDVVGVLLRLASIIRVPADDRTPVTLWHTSLRDFLCSPSRAGRLSASPAHYQSLAHRCIRLAASPKLSRASQYAKASGLRHLFAFLALKPNQCTPSCQTQLAEIMPVLVRANFEDSRGLLEVASQYPDWAPFRALVNEGLNVNAKFSDASEFDVALHAACSRGQREAIDLLLDKGADPNVVASPNRRLSRAGWFYWGFPLAWAASKGDVDLVRKLLRCGADPNLRGGILGTALHCASSGTEHSSYEIARILLENGANPNIHPLDECYAKRTPLHESCSFGRPETTQLLLRYGADPNIKDPQGCTPLHEACGNLGTPEHVFCLLQGHVMHYPDPTIQDVEGHTPLDWAYRLGRRQIVRSLLSYNPNIFTSPGANSTDYSKPGGSGWNTLQLRKTPRNLEYWTASRSGNSYEAQG